MFTKEMIEKMTNEELCEVQENSEFILNKYEYDVYANPQLVRLSAEVDEATNPIECHKAYIEYINYLQTIAMGLLYEASNINDIAKLLKESR